jgi:outer membrane receptor protein involved in Fe transport
MFSQRYGCARRAGRATALLCGLTGASLMQVVAWAQDAQPHGEPRHLPEILVTGTRIAPGDDGTLEPIRVLGDEDIATRGLTMVAEVLDESPGFATAVTPEGNQSSYAPGVNFVNLFGLGTNRTLTLVNGRRVVGANPATLFGPAAPGNQVDLNFIPSILVDRVETLTVGGAPTYGADAIAGVVNVRLRTNYQGLRGFGQYGQLERGGMSSDSFGLLGGRNFAGDRGNVTASLQHSRLDGLMATEIPRFAQAYSFPANPAGGITATQPGRRPDNDGRVNGDTPFNTGPNDGIPNAVLIRDQRMAAVTFGGLAFPVGANNLAGPDNRLRCFGATPSTPGTCLRFANDGNLVPYDAGRNFGLTSASGGDGINPAETTQLMSDLVRTNATLSARFDVSDRVRLSGDLFAYRAEATELVDQTGYNYTAFGGGSSGPITLPADHPTLTPQAREALAGLGVQTFRLSRAHRDLLVNNARGDTDQFQAVLALDGDFDARGRRYDWEVFANFGRRESTYFSNQLDRQRFVNALNVIDVNGQLQCTPNPGYASLASSGGRVQVGADLPVADPGCVPLDIFGEGRPSEAARAYVSSVQRVEDTATQRVFNANVGSTVVDVWGGPVAYNVGFEARREAADFAPDAYLQAGLGRSSPLQAISGSYSTREFFGELVVPLVSESRDVPLMRELTLFGKGRRVDNSVNGQFTAWTGGLRWKPVDDLELRGNLTRSLRAPSLIELYMPVTSRFTSVTDPCSSVNLSGGTHRELRAANCAQFFADYGLPTDGTWQSIANTVSVQGTSQGNLDLRNESANAWTVGFVLSPSRVEGLRLAVDWVDVRVDDAITNVTASDLAEACFDNEQYPNPYCDFLTRNPAGSADAGQITFARSGYANGAYQSMAGVTVDARWRHDFARAGRFELGLEYFRLREELRSATGIVTTNSEEQIGSPTDSLQLNLAIERGPCGARWQTNYVGAQLYSRTFNADSRDVLEVNGDYTHNVSAWYRWKDTTTIRLAVTNLFDGMPPFPIGADAFNGNYDFLGRRFSLSVTHDLGGR